MQLWSTQDDKYFGKRSTVFADTNLTKDFTFYTVSAELIHLFFNKMISCEIDPDVVRWGLHHLYGCTLSNSGSLPTVTQYYTNASRVESVTEDYVHRDINNVENDEMIANALQEELRQVAAVEATGSSHSGEDHLQASILAQDWLGPSKRHSSNGQENAQAVADEMGNSTLFSNFEEKVLDGDELAKLFENICVNEATQQSAVLVPTKCSACYAYVQVDVLGKSFNHSARDAWELFQSIGVEAFIAYDCSGAVLLMGTLLGGLITGNCAGVWALYKTDRSSHIRVPTDGYYLDGRLNHLVSLPLSAVLVQVIVV